MTHLILSSLGIDDSKILSEKDISQLENDLSCLIGEKSRKTGRECLIELEIYDLAKQKINKTQFKKALRFIKEKKEVNLNFEILKSYLSETRS